MKLVIPKIIDPQTSDIPQFYITIDQLPDLMSTFFRSLETDSHALDEFRDMFDEILNGDEEAFSALENFFGAMCKTFEKDLLLVVNAEATKAQYLLNQNSQLLNQKYGLLRSTFDTVNEMHLSTEYQLKIAKKHAKDIERMHVDTIEWEKETKENVLETFGGSVKPVLCQECDAVIHNPHPMQKYCGYTCRQRAGSKRHREKGRANV